jgi:adenosine deaminase CECR1
LFTDAVVSRSAILDIVFDSPDFEHLYVQVFGPNIGSLDFFINPPTGWFKVQGNPLFTKERLLRKLTLLNILTDEAKENPTNTELRWELTDPLFTRTGFLIQNININAKHMEALLNAAVAENVQYLETRTLALDLYALDPDPQYASTNGKRYISAGVNRNSETEEHIRVVNNFTQSHPEFVGCRRILNSIRRFSHQDMHRDMEQAVQLYKTYPDFVVAFDMVAEEDKGNSLLFYMEQFAELVDSGNHTKIPLYLHTVETNWPDDLVTSINPNDPVATEENAYEAVVLGAQRIGHGLGFIKHPYLMDILKQRKVAIESNPVSNQMLGYVTDQRTHPAVTYIRYGIPVVLGSDDPGIFGYDEFTVDWYMVFMGWGINLADMKQLAINSFQYSGLSPEEKSVALSTKWNTAYTKFIAEMKTEACNTDFTASTPSFTEIFPHEAYPSGGIKIQVFGRNFEQGICHDIVCKFNGVSTSGSYVYNNLITCDAPVLPTHEFSHLPHHVTFRVSLDGGATYHGTNQTFTYLDGVPETWPPGIAIG